MKKILIIIICLFYVTSTFADTIEKKAILLAHNFIERLQKDEPFTYEEEIYYFGEINAIGLGMGLHYGYREKHTLKPKYSPKYSYLCELIRRHKDDIILKGAEEVSFTAGKYRAVLDSKIYFPEENDENYEEGDYSSYLITFIQDTGDGNLFDYRKKRIVTFRFGLKNKLSFPILIDGKSLAETIGIEVIDGKPQLKEKVDQWLRVHMDKLNAESESK